MRKLLIVIVVALISMQIQAQTFNFVVKAGMVTKVYPIDQIKQMYFIDLWETHDEIMQIHNDSGMVAIDMKTITKIIFKRNDVYNSYYMLVYTAQNKFKEYDMKLISKVKFVSTTKTGIEGIVELYPLAVFPNPFTNDTKLIFSLKESSDVNIKIIDVAGQQIREYLKGILPQGQNEILWDGKSDSGNPVQSGIYYALISINGEIQITKVIKID